MAHPAPARTKIPTKKPQPARARASRPARAKAGRAARSRVFASGAVRPASRGDGNPVIELEVGAPYYFDEVAAATTSAEHHDHREGLQDAVRQAIATHPAAQWSLSGRSGFVAAIAAQLRNAGVPARSIHKDAFWGMRAPGTAVRPGERAPA